MKLYGILTQLGSNYSSPVAVGTKRQTVLRQSESNCRSYRDGVKRQKLLRQL